LEQEIFTKKELEKWYKLKPIKEQIALINDDIRWKVVVAGRRCWAAGTLVKTPKGSIPIEKLKPGDKIIGWEDESEKITTVKTVFNNGNKSVTPLHDRTTGIEVAAGTPEHRIKTESGLKQIKDINSFTKTSTVNGKISLYKKPNYFAKTYDIEVSNSTSLYVLANGIISHNSGKTERAKRYMTLQCLQNENNSYFFGAPTVGQVKKIYWDHMLLLIPKAVITSINKTELVITFLNGTKLFFIGLDAPERIEGVPWDGCIIDEADNVKEKAWEENILPALMTNRADKPGYEAWAWLMGVPEGRAGLLYPNYLIGLNPKMKNWKSYHWLSKEVLSEEELEELKATMDEKRFKREFEASFEESGNTILYAFSEQNNVIECGDNGGDIHVGMDFNVHPMSAVLGNIVDERFFIWKEYEDFDNANTAKMMEQIIRDYPNRNIIVYPDATGHNRSTTAQFGLTDHKIIEEYGATLVTSSVNARKPDQINVMNALFRDARGHSKVFISPKCTNLIQYNMAWQYDKNTSGRVPDKKSGKDHLPEAMIYVCTRAFPHIYSQQGTAIIRHSHIY